MNMVNTSKFYLLSFLCITQSTMSNTPSSLEPSLSMYNDIRAFTIDATQASSEGGTIVVLKIPTNGKVPPSPSASPGENVRLTSVYLPQGYETSTERYPVIYYLPGLGGTNESFVVGNKIILDNLIAKKEIVPVIVVHNDPKLIWGETPQGTYSYEGSWYVNSALNGAFEDFIIQDTINFIDANLRTKPERAYRGIMGQSMGAYGSIYLGMNHPEKFIGFGACSATPFWTLVTTPFGTVPPDELFSINSLIQFEIPKEGPNAGKIFPGETFKDKPLTNSFFSYSAAFSPDIEAINKNPRNEFQGKYFVDLPFVVNGDGTPEYSEGPVICRSPIPPGDIIIYPQSLVLDPAVVERWKKFDPFTISNNPDVIETMREQAIYIDGGNTEIANARGARLLSEKWANSQIDHEFVLFTGGHVDCLVTPLCSRHQTIFQMLSAVFSENGKDPNTIRSKIAGKGTIIIKENASMRINKGTLIGIETYPTEGTDSTTVTLQLNDNGKILIGDDTTLGGGLQIGDLISKAKVFGDPSLGDNKISATIIIDGPDALLQIGKQGFLGLGVGLVGQFPEIPNHWGMSSLFNAQDIAIDIRQGVFDHNQIASGLEPVAAVLALGPCTNYSFKINPERATMRGGGNMATIPDGWRLQPVNIDEPGVLFPNGVRNVLDTKTTTSDYFYRAEMASTGQYMNESTRNLLSSSEQLDNRGSKMPFEFMGTVSQFSEYLKALVYITQASKEGAIAEVDDRLRIGYLDTINTQPKFVRTSDIPVDIGQEIDFMKIVDQGAIGIWVENVRGERPLIRVFDLEPAG